MNNLCCRSHCLSNILKLQAAFLYSIYHPRAGKTSLCHMRGVDLAHFSTCCTFNLTSAVNPIGLTERTRHKEPSFNYHLGRD